MPGLRSTLAAIVLVAASAAAQTPQSAPPDAPAPTAPASKPSFTLPSATYEVPKGPAPARPKDDSFCFAPPEGVYSKQSQDIPTEFQGPIRNYLRLLYSQVFNEWNHHLSVAERNAWGKKTQLAMRVAIRPDGSYDTPQITLSSGRDRYDAHAIEAVNAFSAFPELPKGFNRPLPVCFRIGYNVDGSKMMFGENDRWQDDAEKKHP